MKTLELELKKKVLIVEIDNKCDITINKDGIYFYFLNGDIEFIEGQFFILCKGSELTEEIASELVHEGSYFTTFKNYITNDNHKSNQLNFATDAFISAVESKEKFWFENPIKHPKDYEVFPDSLSLFAEQEKLHLEAEEKTFRNPLIFVKK